MSKEEAQVQRMVREMRRRKVKSWEFMRYMYITSPHRRLTDIRERGIEVESERVEDEKGNLTRTKQYWIKRRTHKKPEQAMDYEMEKPKSNFFTSRMKAL